MKYGSLSKSKYTSNNTNPMAKTLKPKDMNLKMKNTNNNTLVVEKEVKGSIITSFRPGILSGVTVSNKFRTSKNSPERDRETLEQRNFSGDRKGIPGENRGNTKMLLQNYLNINIKNNPSTLGTQGNGVLNSSNNIHMNTPNTKLKEIIEEDNGIEALMKQKILKKKEKIKTNLLNFSNPYSNNNKLGPGYYKIHLETSAHNQNPGLYSIKKELEIGRYDDRGDKMRVSSGNKNNHKRSNSTYEEEEVHSQRQEIKKNLLSPRIDNLLNKYYENRTNSGGNQSNPSNTNTDWKKNSIIPRVSNTNNNNLSSQMNYKLSTSSHKYTNSNEYIINNKDKDMETLSYKYSNLNKKHSSTSTKQGTMSGTMSNFASTQKSLNFGPNNDLRVSGNNNINNNKYTINNFNYTPNIHKEKIDLSQITHRDTSQISLKHNVSKTTAGTKNNSRKNSVEKILKNTKNLFLATNKNTIKNSINTSTNSSNTLLTNNKPYMNNNNNDMDGSTFGVNYNHMNFNNHASSSVPTEQSQSHIKKGNPPVNKTSSGFHNQGLSEIPVLSSVNMNILNNPKNTVVTSTILSNNLPKNFLYNNNLKYYNNNVQKQNKNSSINSSSNNGPSGVNGTSIISGVSGISGISNKRKEEESILLDKSLKRKFGPIPITTVQSKNNSKNNSKSVSRIEDIIDTPYSNIYMKQNAGNIGNSNNINKAKGAKSNSLTKKYIPITTSHSPTNMFAKEIGFNKERDKDKENVNNISNNKASGNAGNAPIPSSKLHTPLINSEKQTKEKISMKINLDMNILKKNEKGVGKNSNTINTNSVTLKDDYEKKNSLEGLLDNSSDSIRSTMRESNYYRRESEKITNYIRQSYQLYSEYPKTIWQFYKYGRLLGRGAFGKVNLALHIGSGHLVAIKSFNKNKLTSENAKRKINHETNILKNLKHNSVVKIYETFETTKYILIVMEYVCCGDLLSFVRKRSKLNETTAKFIFKQIIEALQYIHSQNIVHRDIKLDNILIDLQNNIKICDFGVSKQVKKGDVMHDQCGTPAYIAPEILRNQGYEGFSVDVWSAGVVLYAMLSGTVPFKANNMNDLHKLIIKGNFQYIKDISEDAHNLIVSILEVDPKKRITIDNILNHPWLKSIDKTKSKMNLFTAAEKILLAKSNLDYRYANKDEIIENFTIRNLDTLQETENQNINTKSIILAPFNSSIKPNDSFLNKDLNIENEVLKFHGKVKELNRNYELNNNGEIDNGIIISPQEGSKNNSITPIYSPYAPSPFHNSFNNNLNNNNNNNNRVISKPISPAEFDDKYVNNGNNNNGIGNKGSASALNSPKDESIHRNFIKNGNNLHSIKDQFAIDEKVIREVEEIGYKKEYIIKSLLNNEINYATASYYLLLDNSRRDY